MPRRRRPGGRGREGGGPQARGSAPTMSAPAPSPPAGAPPEPRPPPERDLFNCYECGRTIDLHRSRPTPYSSPHRVCPSCCRGFLEGTPPSPPPPPPPPPPVLLYCHECGATVDLHGPPPNPPSSPHRVCPSCCRGFLEENPPPPLSPPPPPPPPHFLSSGSSSSSSSSEFSDEPDDFGIQLLRRSGVDFNTSRGFLSRFATQSPYERALAGDFAAVAAMTVLRENARPQRQLGPSPSAGRGGEPPAPAASIAALPTVEVAEPAAACAICKEDLPLASQARKLPCAHLYHSSCIVTWLEMHNSCPVCRFRIPAAADPEGAVPSERDSSPTRITIRFTTSTRRRGRAHGAAPVSASPTQLAQALTGDGAGGPANSGETVSSEWPPHPESDAVMSEAREGDGFFD